MLQVRLSASLRVFQAQGRTDGTLSKEETLYRCSREQRLDFLSETKKF